jgi:hypothetical protein
MIKLVAILFIAILAGSITLPNVFSDDEKNANDNNENVANMHENKKNKDNEDNTYHGEDENEKEHVHFGFSSATSVNITLPNGTKVTFGFSNSTNVGQQISSFVHFIRDIFKQDDLKSKQIIKDCREKARNASPADRKNIMSECKAKLKEIKQQLRSEHKQLQMDFRQFQEMIVGNNQQKSSQQVHQNLHAQGNHENQNKESGKIHGHSQHGNQNIKSHVHYKEG